MRAFTMQHCVLCSLVRDAAGCVLCSGAVCSTVISLGPAAPYTGERCVCGGEGGPSRAARVSRPAVRQQTGFTALSAGWSQWPYNDHSDQTQTKQQAGRGGERSTVTTHHTHRTDAGRATDALQREIQPLPPVQMSDWAVEHTQTRSQTRPDHRPE